MEKRSALEEKQRKWMDDRHNTLHNRSSDRPTNKLSQSGSTITNNNVEKRITKSNSHTTNSNGPSKAGSKPKSATGLSSRDQDRNDDLFLNKLTEKLSTHIRDEVRKELQGNFCGEDMRDVVSDKMESYLQGELHMHLCKLCSQLMRSPDHTPMLLFPCGHTFCRSCIEQRQSKRQTTCAICREHVDSMAVNQSLKELVDNFAAQRDKVHNPKMGLHEIFDNGRSSTGGISANKSKYSARYNSCETRRQILLNERGEEAEQTEGYRKKKKSILAVEQMLRQERDGVEVKLQQLREEMALIDKHLRDQEKKRKELEDLEAASVSRVALIEDSIGSLEGEMEKLKLLAEADS